MGNLNKHFITYTLIATVVVFMGFFSLVKENKGSIFSTNNRGTGKNQVLPFHGRTIFKRWKNKNDSLGNPSYVNNYRPGDNVVISNDDPQNGALVSSVTYADKKKAKKAKKKTVAKETKKSTTSSRNNKLSASNYNANNVSSGGGGAGGGTKPQKPKQEEENLDTVQYWEEPIFKNEDPAAVSKLIDSYRIQKVSSGVFYEVVSEMSQDERPQLREYAIVALQSTPSTKSFYQLTKMKLNDTDAEIRISAEAEVAHYADVGRLSYVISSLKTSGGEAQQVSLEAMRVLTKASENYGEIHAQSNDGTHSSTQMSASMQTKLTQAYNTLGTIAQSNDPELKSEAVKTMDSISKAITI
jgi:hypothetical protein